MSIDRSLKIASGLIRHRNVLSRAERVAKLAEKNVFDWSAGNPLGLPKVGNRKIATGGKTKKEKAAEGTAEAGAAAPAAAGPAAAAKPAGKATAAKK